jgi:hypothetical protein
VAADEPVVGSDAVVAVLVEVVVAAGAASLSSQPHAGVATTSASMSTPVAIPRAGSVMR